MALLELYFYIFTFAVIREKKDSQI